jgi:integrase
MVMFMLKAGLQISEVKDLDVLSVDEHYGRVTISAGKGGKWREVYMNTDLLNAYRELMKKRGKRDGSAVCHEQGKTADPSGHPPATGEILQGVGGQGSFRSLSAAHILQRLD